VPFIVPGCSPALSWAFQPENRRAICHLQGPYNPF
jgi:hypothetical protein